MDNSSNDLSLEKLIRENWDTIKDKVRSDYDLTDISYTTWIAPLEFLKLEDSTVIIVIQADNDFHRNYIAKNFEVSFMITITEMFDQPVNISFVLKKDVEKKQAESKKIEDSSSYNTTAANANLNARYTFDSFVVGNNNKFAHSAALAVAESPGDVYNPLFIYGGSGLGKTHLMHAIGHFILSKNPKTRILYVPSEQFINEVIENIRGGSSSSMNRLREKYRSVDVLMVDDIQFIIGKESTQEEFFHTFNFLMENGKQIIISSDKPPKAMETLDERFRSRFLSGLIADVSAPDYETRVAILQKNARLAGYEIDDKVLFYIANNIQSNIRELEGAFKRIIAYSKINNIKIESLTEEDAIDALKDVISYKEITPELILNIVSEHFGIPLENIVSKDRRKEYVTPRHAFMYLCSTLIKDMTYVEIGKYVGTTDHTSVMNGIRRTEEKIAADKQMAAKINTIISMLKIN